MLYKLKKIKTIHSFSISIVSMACPVTHMTSLKLMRVTSSCHLIIAPDARNLTLRSINRGIIGQRDIQIGMLTGGRRWGARC